MITEWLGATSSALNLSSPAPVDRAEEAYWERCTAPMQRAAVALVLTPAPDLAAVRAKVAIIRAHQLEELDAMVRHPFDVVDEDLGRLMEAGATA